MEITKILEILNEKYSGQIMAATNHNDKRTTLNIKPEALVNIAQSLYEEMNLRFIIASGLHTKAGFEIYYHFSHDISGHIINLHVILAQKEPGIESLTKLFSGAEWIEREIHELLGINFNGHPNLVPLLSEGNWPEGTYPYRKDFKS